VAGGALALEHLFARLERPVGVADFHGADLLDPCHHALLAIVGGDATERIALGLRIPGRLVFRDDVIDETDDPENRDDEREEHRQQQLPGCPDRAGVGLFLRRVAHGVLKKSGVKSTFDYSQPLHRDLACGSAGEFGSRMRDNAACSFECGCSSVDRVLASEAKGRGFDPRQPHQQIRAPQGRPATGPLRRIPVTKLR
jgi:hypothetical protein